MRKLFALVIALNALNSPSTTAADSVPKSLQETLSKRFPDIQITGVHASIFPGLFEVVTANEIVYADASGQHVILGKVLNTETHENLTEKRWNELSRIDFNALPFDLAIKMVKGDGSRKLAVFADPQCPFCRKLEQEMQAITDVTVYTFLYPIESIHPGAQQKAKQIWCSSDRAGVWSDWMLKKTEPGVQECADEPTEKLMALGDKLRVIGTPTLFFPDGHRVPGAIQREQLEQELSIQGKGKTG